MKIKFLLLVALLTATLGMGAQGRFEAGDGTFLLNGEPYVVKAAELHYPRIPRQYWDHRIKMCKALGMNTVCLYVFWNAHEPEPDRFDFEGQNDLRAFVKLCQENGMNVILRPGPYVCAEWEMGGLPWWLLKKKDIRLREQDPYFIERVDKFQKAVAAQVGDLTVADGGPIIMVQVENEYGSYGTDKRHAAPQFRRQSHPVPVRLGLELPQQRPRRPDMDGQFRHRRQHRRAVCQAARGASPQPADVLGVLERMV